MTIESSGEIIARRPWPPGNSGNHNEGCWKLYGHHNCAVAEIERLKKLVIELGGDPVARRSEKDA